MHKQKTIEISKGTLFWLLYAAGVFLLRLMMTNVLPIHARPSYITDDYLQLSMAMSLMQGKWLGYYSGVLLMKGCTFPIFTAVCASLGVPFLTALGILNGASCFYLTASLEPLLKRKWKMAVFYTFILFSPALCTEMLYQRFYRNSLTQALVMLIFGAWFFMYFSKENLGRMLLHAIFGGAVLCAFLNNREDSFFILPFVICASVTIFAGSAGTLIRKHDLRRLSLTLLCLLAPFFITMAGNWGIRLMNYRYYGKAVRLEMSEGSFPKAFNAIYSVVDPDEQRQVSVSREKLKVLYTVSPTLSLIRDELDGAIDNYLAYDKRRPEITDATFIWILRRAAFDSGEADTAQKAESFYAAVAKELNEAMDRGIVGSRGHMPSPLMSPWQPGFEKILPKEVRNTISVVIDLKGLETGYQPYSKLESVKGARRFEQLTGGIVIYPTEVFDDSGVANIKSMYAGRLNRIYEGYRKANHFLLYASVFLMTLYLFIRMFRKRLTKEDGQFYLLVSSMGLTAVLIVAGISYTTVSAYKARTQFYLAGTYPLMFAVEALVLLYCADIKKVNG